ncbi:MAG: restriction endonuclease subunit S [Eubacteriales bacterium]|nr:restriction endonuclease subunit S [Eubacteriales bacterium]
MSKTTNLVPKRRFKEFQNAGDWEQRKLGELIDVRSGRDYKHLSKGDIPVYGTGGYMLSVNEALSYNEDAIGIGRKGTIDKPYVLKAPFWTVDTLFYAVPRDEYELNFVFDIFQNIDWKKKDESTGVPSLSKTAINEINVLTPQYDEQKIIGGYFAQIDNLITLHQRKLEKIKALRSAYLSEMFPVEGEREPKRRFAEYTDAWEQRKVGELASVSMNRRIFKAQTTETGEVPFFKIGTFGGTPDAYISRDLFEEYRAKYPYPKVGDILISASGSIGRTVEYSGDDEYFQDSNIVWINHDERIDNSFLKCFYAVVQWAGIEGSTIKRLYNDNILNTEICLPSVSEQQQIGAFFRNLDNLITLHQYMMEKLQNVKKAYLNEMFI